MRISGLVSFLVLLLLPYAVAAEARVLDKTFLLGQSYLDAPLPMQEFARPDHATEAKHEFSGSLRLVDTDMLGNSHIVHDAWNRVGEIGEAIRHIPEFEFRFVQRRNDLVPLQRGIQRREHPYWEVILQPGKAWHEEDDGDWSRASVSFSLQERAANCTHNGVLTWLYNDYGVSRVAYQVSGETCGYFKIDLWGVVPAQYVSEDFSTTAAVHAARVHEHREKRLPVRPLAQLADDYPGLEPMSLAIGDGIDPADLTVYGMVIDGVNYRSECYTRHGPHPYCDSLPLPSYSTAKSIFAGIATMRVEKLFPGTSQSIIASVIDQCDSPRWRDVRVEDALDMATGNYLSIASNEDEDGMPHRHFLFRDNHAEKLAFACEYFDRRSKPGTQFVYHTSDTYLVGTALQQIIGERLGAHADIYDDIMVRQIWDPIGLSPLLRVTKRTYDDAAQPLAGYGLTYELDDILRISLWLQSGASIGGEGALDFSLLNSSLQRDSSDPGLAAGSDRIRYNNGFWAYDAGPSLGCEQAAWIPFMSGVSGITVAMFPNGVIYYYFSDSYIFRWQSARVAAHKIRRLCE